MDKKELEKIKEINEEPNLRKKRKKIKKHLRKYDSLRKVKLNPEEKISEASLLNAENLYKLLVFLRDIYPIGYSFEGIEKKMNLEILLRRQLDELVRYHLIGKRNLSEFEERMLPENFKKFFPEYVITIKGMEFVNGIEVRNLSRKINRLTKILIGFGIITLIIVGNQLLFQILQYLALR